jgi:hypothetical protein
MKRHCHSLFAKTRAIFAAMTFLCTNLAPAFLTAPLVYADSHGVAIADDTKDQGQKTQLQPLGPAFKGKLPITELTEDEAILHALNRLGYGPRPGDLERVKQMGLENWIELQLHPEKIDEPILQARLSRLPAANLNSQALLAEYPQPDTAAKRLGITVDEYRKQMDAEAHPPQGVRPKPSKLPQEALNQL